jgi:zinc protease
LTLLALLATTWAAPVWAQKSQAKPAAPTAAEQGLKLPQLSFERYALENGLTVILHRDPALPRVAVNIWYHVGPRNEPSGRSGFAHLFEHLMFAGSRHVGREFDRLLESVGATNVNGTTSYDRTNYYATVPREHLDLVLWIESDRMGYLLDVVDKAQLDIQRDVVKNERRQSFENSPYGPSYLTLVNTLFPAGHPYHGAVIGSMQDLSAATLADVRDFFHDYYTPSNATLTLAGDFEIDAARASIRKYFGTLAKRERKTVPERKLPEARAGRYVVEEPIELGQVMFGFRTPPAYSRDDVVVDVAMTLLAGGRATRLYQQLVVEEKLSSEVSAHQESNQLSGMAVLSATVATGKPLAELERGLERAVEALSQRGPTAEELQRAKRRILVSVLKSLELLNGGDGESGRAGMLQRFAHYTGDPGYLPRWVEQVQSVTSAEVQRALAQHFTKDKRVTVVTQPKAASTALGKNSAKAVSQ